MKIARILFVMTGLVIASCSQQSEEKQVDSSQHKTAQTSDLKFVVAPRLEKNYLTQEQAEMRSNRVSNVSYNLNFVLTGAERFNAVSEISFDLSDTSQPLTVDLDKAEIKNIIVNGEKTLSDYNQSFITIQANALKVGNNTIKVDFSRLHSTNGEGLHRFVDPLDNKVYLYSHFEPAAAHQMFASFDQPDLKATYKLTAQVPKGWTVISATREDNVTEKGETVIWSFPVSKKLSPYNFSMHAGPYKKWEDNSGKYPMRLFIRQSLADKINPKDWFNYTAKGLTFFDQYFDTPYPFKKYDQILVPDFLYGAMENAASVTFAERRFTSSSQMTTSQKQRLAGVIMHEMAHQWFGDLVTMKWWNGLWLNESFASFMGTLATAEATEFDYAWRSFYAFSKQGAYSADQRVTTHPIEVPVKTTANAFDNIDAITYSKGASTLMQLRHLLGPDVFQKGVQNYLKKYAYQNAKLDDFIGSLAQAAGRDLNEWKQQWLYQPGVNGIKADYECSQGKISRLSLEQSFDKKYPVLREQKIQLGLFKIEDHRIVLDKAIPVTYKGEKTEVDQAVGAACPALLYPNYQDWGFVKVTLDPRSFQTAKEHLAEVDDPLLRSMLWQSLWDSVKDGDLGLEKYMDVALFNIASEKDYTILGQALGGVARANSYLNLLGDKANAYQQKIQPNREAIYWKKANDHLQDYNFQRRWLSSFISNASTAESLDRLKRLLNGKLKIERIDINQDIRWDIIYQLNRYLADGSLQLIEQELKKDSGDSGQKSAIAATVVRPESSIKREWLDKILDEKSTLPFSKLRIAMGNLYTSEQSELVEQTADEILVNLAKLDATKGPVYMRSFAGSLIPATCNEASVKRLKNAIDDNSGLSNVSMRPLLVAHQEDERCVLIGAKLNTEN